MGTAMSGYYMGTVPEQLTAGVRRPDLGSRVQGLSARLSSSAEDLAYRQSMYARERNDMEDRLSSMQHHVAALQGEKARAEHAWWNEKEALLRGWSGDHNRLVGLVNSEGLPVPGELVPVGPPGMPFLPPPQAAQLAGDRLMQEFDMMRQERSAAAVPERRAAECRVRALEVQLARENHAREFASFANADRGIAAFRREPASTGGASTASSSTPIGDTLNAELRQTEAE